MQGNNPRVTLLLVHEFGGRATAIARISDPAMVAQARKSAVDAKQTEARTAHDPFTRRRAEMEAALIQQA